MPRIKVCGITRLGDAIGAVARGADALGFVFHPGSPRYIEPRSAWEIVSQLPPFVVTVGVFVNPDIGLVCDSLSLYGMNVVQLHGDETPEFCGEIKSRTIKALRVKGGEHVLQVMKGYRVSSFLLDTYSPKAYGGTGKVFNWDIATEAKKHARIILSGGLTPENVYDAVTRVSPYGVDVSSGVETSPGKKDLNRVQIFIEEIRRAENAS